jgi:hypothetical protein
MKTSKLTTILALIFVIFASVEIVKNKEVNFHKVSYMVQAVEEKLKLENWMVNESYWKYINNNGHTREHDKSLSHESWMTDRAGWEFAALLPLEIEKPLKLEAWMTNEKFWNKEEVIFAGIEGIQ